MSERRHSVSGTSRTPLTRQPAPSARLETRRRQHLKRHTIELIKNYTIELIKHSHPEWIAADGSCEPCLSYYDEFDADVTFTPVPNDA